MQGATEVRRCLDCQETLEIHSLLTFPTIQHIPIHEKSSPGGQKSKRSRQQTNILDPGVG